MVVQQFRGRQQGGMKAFCAGVVKGLPYDLDSRQGLLIAFGPASVKGPLGSGRAAQGADRILAVKTRSAYDFVEDLRFLDPQLGCLIPAAHDTQVLAAAA
ncbi:MAG: hypothetical protein ACYC5Y_13920 [Symbiobacteriia bacterium]